MWPTRKIGDQLPVRLQHIKSIKQISSQYHPVENGSQCTKLMMFRAYSAQNLELHSQVFASSSMIISSMQIHRAGMAWEISKTVTCQGPPKTEIGSGVLS